MKSIGEKNTPACVESLINHSFLYCYFSKWSAKKSTNSFLSI